MAFTERYVSSVAGGGGDGSLGNPWTLSEAVSAAVAGDRVNILAGTYTLGSSFTPVNDGASGNPVVWRGYTSTPGDAVQPVVTFDINGVGQHVIDSVRAYHRFECITVTGNAGIGGSIVGFNLSGEANLLYRCRATDVNRGASVTGQGTQLIGCEIDAWTSGAGIQLDAENAAAIGCYVHDGAGLGCGFKAPSSGGYYYCVSANNGTHGFSAGQSGRAMNRWLVHCIAYGNAGYGTSLNGSPEGQPLVVVNSLMVANSLYGIGGENVATGMPHVSLLGCGFQGNSGGEVEPNVSLFEPVARVSFDEDPIVDAAGGDFRLRPDAVSALGVGFPGAMLVDGVLSEWRGAPDLGTVQAGVRPLVNPSFVGAF